MPKNIESGRAIAFLGRTFSGHHNDCTMLKQEFPDELDQFCDIDVRVDLGYQGIQSDYSGNQIDMSANCYPRHPLLIHHLHICREPD